MSYPASSDVSEERLLKKMQKMMDQKLAVLEKKTKEQDEKIAAGAEENKKLKEKMAAVEQGNEKLKEKMAAVEEENKKLKGNMAAVEQEYEKLIEKMAAVEEENKKLKKKMTAVEQGNEKLKEITDKMMNPEALYGYFEGDEYYYMKLEKLIPLLKKCCNGNEKKMKELDEWEQDVKKKAGKRYWKCLGGSALAGAAVGGAVVGASHYMAGSVICLGGKTLTTITGLCGLPALGVVAAFAAGGAAIFLIKYGITKKYRENEADETVRKYDESAERADEIQKTSGRGKKLLTGAMNTPLGRADFKVLVGN